MTQELRKLAEAVRDAKTHNELVLAQTKLDDSLTSRQLLELLDRLEKAEKDAGRRRNLCNLINDDRVSVTFYGRVDTINSGLEVHDSADLHDELDIAMEASK